MESLTAIEGVRKRPGMYVGDTNDGTGLMHLALEVIANAYDQYLVGRCTSIGIELGADGTIVVEDDGPGIEIDEQVLTTLDDRPTKDGHRPHVHLGTGGLGLCIVNALSERLELRTIRDGVESIARCARGRLVAPIATAPATRPRGTMVRFRPDPEIFAHLRVPRVLLTAHLEDLAFLSSGLTLRWTIAGDDVAARGLAARVAIGVPCAVDDVAHHREMHDTPTGPIDVEVAIAWRDGGWHGRAEQIDSFVNLGRTRGGGVHVAALLAGVGKFVGVRPRERSRHGLVAAVSVVLTDVLFGNPTRDKLISAEVRGPVTAATQTALAVWERAHPEAAAALRGRLR